MNMNAYVLLVDEYRWVLVKLVTRVSTKRQRSLMGGSVSDCESNSETAKYHDNLV